MSAAQEFGRFRAAHRAHHGGEELLVEAAIDLGNPRHRLEAPRIRRIVLMGGGFFEGGNVTPAAEFNIYVDPQAAHEVFTSGVPITMAPLDVTHEALTTAKRIEAIRALPNRVGAVVAAWMEFFERFDEEKYGQDGGPLHDPCVI
eukprot:gene13952-17046_t